MKRFMFCMLLLSVPASAEFTVEEKLAVREQVVAIHDEGHSHVWLLSHLAQRPQDVTQVVSILNTLLTARQNHMAGLFYLLDGDPSISRAQAITTATNSIASASYASAISQMQALTPTPWITTAIQLVQGAEARRAAFDPTLDYSEPRLDENLAMPGATRAKSANAGPHGDYVMALSHVNRMDQLTTEWIRQAGAAALANPAFVPVFSGTVVRNNLGRLGKYPPALMGLLAGVEHPDWVAGIDTQFNGGTSRRSRHFWRISSFQEALLGWDHTAPFDKDVFGRTVARGLTYDLTASCRAMMDFAAADASVPSYARSLFTASKWMCESWARLDGSADSTRVFRFFTNVGSPGQVVGVCGADTTMEPGPPPTCVGIGGGGNSCGTGTHLEGTVCVADPCPSCPTPITCGAGTHIVGTECLPDPAPSCPTFLPTATLEPIPGTTAFGFVPQCVEQ